MDAICFDLDDTLYDYQEYARAGLREAADRLESQTGHRLHDEMQATYFEADITDGTFDRILERYGLPADLLEGLIDAYHEATTPLSPYDDTELVLEYLSEDYQLGLVTDGRGGHAKLDRLGLEAYFDAVLVTPTIGTSKRSAEPFDVVLSALSVSPEEAVYVGDDPRFDFEVPNEMGMTTIRLRRGRYETLEPRSSAATPDHEITRLERLRECL